MAAALVGGAFLSATLQVLFDRLASREFVNFFRAQKLDDKLLRKLKSTLRGLNVLLDDAEDKQITNLAVKDWMDELKVAVYHADDLLDEIATEALRCKSEAKYHSGSDQVRSPTLISSSSSFDADIVSKIEEIIDRLECFPKEKDVLGLREVAGQKLYHGLPTTSLVDESGVFGRDNDKEDVIKLLLSDEASGGNQKIDVIAIVGMGGVGKTTLAQFLYNDGRVDDHFDMKAWVCVSDEFDVVRVTRTILKAVIPQGSDTMDLSKKDLNELQVKLKECLSGKKFLMVLDDVWNENYVNWDSLRSPFEYGGHGSRVIVTTRNESVSSIMQTVPIHRLQQLSDEDCWKLFAKHAFEKRDCGAHPNLERIGKEVVKKCKGLPLAAKTLAGLLRSKRDVEDWNNILKSGIWDLPKQKSNILPALKLSYHYLPSHLKRCFAYCSIFPKDHEFEMERLVLMWMAEGFVEQPRSKKTREEVGYECFNELQSRSFFQRSNANKYCFVMHDLVNDLAQAVSRDFCYMLGDNTHHISERVHHFSCVRGKFDGFEKYKLINDAKFLRTFLTLGYSYSWLSKKVLDDILPKLTCLRLLSLSRYKIMELPHSIGNLLHLRYLDLSYTKIKQLPESVCTMYNLETLLLYNCRQLITLPVNLQKLIQLRHLDLTGTNLQEMPMQMSQLKDLQLLTAFVVGKSKGLGIEELKEFHHLQRRLSISSLQNVTNGMGAMEAKLEEKMYLEELVLEWSSSTNDSQNERDVLDKLKPHTNLKRLEIKNFGGTRFPDWLGDKSFCNIVHMSLDNCEYCFSLPPFGQLPSLKDLEISRMQGITKVGHEFYGDSSLRKPFQSLETLIFEEMLEWVDWYILESGEFSKLKELHVIKCPKLIGGLPKHIPSCVRLEIQKCSRLMAQLSNSCGAGTSELVLNRCDGVELGCRGLSSLTKLKISGMPNLKELTPELCTLTNLKEFRIDSCPSLLSFPDTGLPPMLTHLSICHCKVLHSLLPRSEDMENCYKSLETLSLSRCDALKPMWLGFFPKLRSLGIRFCTNFNSITDLNMLGLQNLASLESLFLSGFSNLISFPQGGLPGLKLTNFRIRQCKKLESLPEGMHALFPSLQSLELVGCREIKSFPEGGLPSSLRSLEIQNCSKLTVRRREWDLQRLPSLRHFRLVGGDGVESFPEEGLLPATLMSLRIDYLPNLKSLNNRGLQLLGSLKYIKILGCPQLQSLVEEGLPTSLFMLEFFGCPMLKPRYLKGEGQDWHKIACVPVIHMDGEVIFDQLTLRPAMDSQPGTLMCRSEIIRECVRC
ncbi:putative disease resistance RPP13-like protein 1 isoform X1 [Camellia sinensis]|uniref:putative disease resistance RPP13-like protein 1 isoform X1 n=1 Tax=Camellia sinensis TaxID=4442 RepID=UPI001035E37B|nr:putative disease resistance RPP13-like protein 1 isoform X1 [Camellia sinensis]XP_028099984.1 putative disease resistance RPP13-like protein 1 isoform X1 [Camellia sinensis]XP_028099985.1 putative disease resistance RPP13-like protein 1 isoform X1 [Camellia sinensis]XP_028099986.1 putative disease resistance RPP13-like protein 1 isoform X1 [Camellia sinensis]XP_028099987.1 putative disease resistance RPP13-like protein 1 isoform X1 [Camellia sinensis]XP_028099988.1 putative disease resistan